jgi:hypothetical protein
VEVLDYQEAAGIRRQPLFLTEAHLGGAKPMRTLILVAGAALALAACRNNDQVDNTGNVDENLSAENVVSNDVTAIDAVTGEDANMAADVNYTDTSLNNGTSELNDAASNTASPSPKPTKQAPKTPTKPKAESETTNNA